MSVKAIACYFIFQIFGSLFFIYGFIYNSSLIFSIIGLIVKLGIFPFHIWQPFVFLNINWKVCALLAGPQKVVLILIFIWLRYDWNTIFINNFLITILIGNVCLLFFKDLKKAFAYLSIRRTAWLIISRWYLEQTIWFLSFYNFQLLLFFFAFFVIEISSIFRKKLVDIRILIFIIAYSGIPPFIGFFLKAQVLIFFSTLTNNIIITFILTISIIPSIFFIIYYTMKLIFFQKDTSLARGELIIYSTLVCTTLFLPFFFILFYFFSINKVHLFSK